MSSRLILDLSDPGIKELVAKWKNGESYRAEIVFTQNDVSSNLSENTVTKLTALDQPEAEVEEAEEVATDKPEPPKKKPTMPPEY